MRRRAGVPCLPAAASRFRPGGTGGQPAKYEQAKIELSLFDLENDIGETTNVADQHPEVVARLKASADAMRKQLGHGPQNVGTQRRTDSP